jgi:hypothetical protein
MARSNLLQRRDLSLTDIHRMRAPRLKSASLRNIKRVWDDPFDRNQPLFPRCCERTSSAI